MTRDRGLRRRSMASILMIFLLSSLLGLHSTESQMDDKQVRFPSICPGLRCPRGHSSYCPLQVQNQTASCIPCEKGTYSMHSSRRRACRPCSRCRSNEFELWPCSQTSDVVCKECRRCPPGVEVLVSCQRTRDTICREKCRLPLQFQDIQGAGCERAKPQITGDHTLSTEQKQGKEMHNDSLTIIVQNRTTKAISPTQSSLTLPPYEIKTKIMFSRDPSAVTRKSKLLKTELRAAVTRRSSGNYDVEMPNPGNKSGSDTKLSLNAVLTISLLAVILLSLILSGILMQRYKKSAAKKGCLDVQSEFGECLRESRCLPSSDCCTAESTLSCDSNSDKTEECHVPRPVLGSLQMQVTVDVHSSVCDVLPTITESCQCTRSYPEFITSVENIFDSNGGTLSHPDSNVSINVDSGAIPDGVSQRIFFQVVYDERLLLRDIPQTPGNTLICPVIQCGPGNISLLKPVEIVLPHCLYLDETKKESIIVYKCERFSDQGPLNWEIIPLASEKNNQSKAWFTVKMDTIHIKTKTFSFWSVFSCGGPKKKRATVFASKPNPLTDLLYLRFYIYSDNDDSKKRVERKDREQFSDSKRSKEKPFKVYNDSKDIKVWLNPEDLSKDGWEMDKTAYTQIYSCESAYKNGFRSKDSCDFAVKPIAARVGSVKGFSCDLKFQQEDHREHSIYVNPGFSPVAKQSVLPFSDESNTSSTSTSSSSSNVKCQSLTTRETANGDDKPSSVSSVKLPQQPTGRDDEPVTEKHCRCICSDIGSQWKPVLRNLPGIKEKHLENLEEDYKNCKVNEKCLQGLLEWRRIAGPQKATTRALCKSLQQEGCLDALEDLWKGGFERNSHAAIPESTAEMCV